MPPRLGSLTALKGSCLIAEDLVRIGNKTLSLQEKQSPTGETGHTEMEINAIM
jgi:hypothetical protein